MVAPEAILPLVITHLIPYPLLLWIIWIFQKRKTYYEEKIYSTNLIQWGVICLIVALLSEFFWHWFVQNWDYRNESHVLNFLMYFLMNVGFSLWSLGLKREKWTDIGLAASVIITPVAYVLEIKPIIWITQLYILVILTIRGKQVTMDARAYLFLVFSFGVNMVFIMLLFATNDPLYHILHDIAGTLLGLWIFAYLFWINPKRKQSCETPT